MSTHVSIGEFSRLSHLSVKALRHYHEVGVLVPADVDPASGYRRYELDQLGEAHLIRRLRDLEMPLGAVREVVSESDPDSRDRLLAAHLDSMERELARTRGVVRSLRELIEAPLRPFDVEIRHVDATTALATRAVVAQDNVGDWSYETFAGLVEEVGRANTAPAGAPGSLFGRAFFEEGVGEVVAFLPVSAQHDVPGATETIEIPGGTYAATVHKGPYADLDRTYGVLGGYVASNLSAADGPIREHYVVGGAELDPADLRTELLWPITP